MEAIYDNSEEKAWEDWDKPGPYLRTGINKSKASGKQVGGDHYKGFPIQPAYFCYMNKIPYLEATAIKYLCRWRNKGGIQDLDKAIHFIELVKEFENVNAN